MGAVDFWGNAADQLMLCVLGVAHLVRRRPRVGGCSAEFFVFLSQKHMVFSLVPGLGEPEGLICLQSNLTNFSIICNSVLDEIIPSKTRKIKHMSRAFLSENICTLKHKCC